MTRFRRSSHPHGPSLEDPRPLWRWLALVALLLILLLCAACWQAVAEVRSKYLGPGLRRGESPTDPPPATTITPADSYPR